MTFKWRILPSETPYMEFDGKKGAGSAYECLDTDEVQIRVDILLDLDLNRCKLLLNRNRPQYGAFFYSLRPM